MLCCDLKFEGGTTIETQRVLKKQAITRHLLHAKRHYITKHTGHTSQQPTYLITYLLTYLPTYLPNYLPTYLLTYLTTYLLTYLPNYLLAYLPTYLLTYLPNYLIT